MKILIILSCCVLFAAALASTVAPASTTNSFLTSNSPSESATSSKISNSPTLSKTSPELKTSFPTSADLNTSPQPAETKTSADLKTSPPTSAFVQPSSAAKSDAADATSTPAPSSNVPTKLTSSPTILSTQSSTSAATSKAPITTTATPTPSTKAPTNSTTSAPQTTSTTHSPTKPTPTPTAAPKLIKFEVKNKGKACLIGQGMFSLEVMEDKKKMTILINEAIDANGVCAKNNTSPASVSFIYNKDTKDSVTFNFTSDGKIATLSEVSATYTVNKTQKTATNPKLNMQLSPVSKYYKCMASQPLDVDKSVQMMVSEFQVQVYNVDGTFSKEGFECAADPSTPPPPLPQVAPSGTYYFSDNKTICLYTKFGLRFDIKYNMTNGTSATQKIDLPNNSTEFKVEGTCGQKTETMNITFFKDWKLVMIISKADSYMLGDDKAYRLTEVELTYVMDDHFYNAKKSDTPIVAKSAAFKEVFRTEIGAYYVCNSERTLTINSEVDIQMWNTKIEAFKTDSKTDFTGTPIKCIQDQPVTGAIIPIAVGGALAGLVVIVVAVYLVARARKQDNYQSV